MKFFEIWCYRTARNPHDLQRYTGGSSSGPGAIVASGLCPVALGTDCGGMYIANFWAERVMTCCVETHALNSVESIIFASLNLGNWIVKIGSIRIPSALCGNIGLKPTFGRTSNEGYESLLFLEGCLFKRFLFYIPSFGWWGLCWTECCRNVRLNIRYEDRIRIVCVLMARNIFLPLLMIKISAQYSCLSQTALKRVLCFEVVGSVGE